MCDLTQSLVQLEARLAELEHRFRNLDEAFSAATFHDSKRFRKLESAVRTNAISPYDLSAQRGLKSR